MSTFDPHALDRDGAAAMDDSLLSAYLDDELDADTRVAVEARLAASPEWRAVLDEVRDARDAVRALPLVDAPAGFYNDLLGPDRRALDLGAARRRRAVRPKSLPRRLTSVAAAATFVVLGVALVPREQTVQPPINTFTNAHAERSSVGNDVVSNLAGASVTPSVGK
jgi:anti-sigma factor RsiW